MESGRGHIVKGALFCIKEAPKVRLFHDKEGHFNDIKGHFPDEMGHFYDEFGPSTMKSDI